jgi:hypothetical protein
MAEKREPRPQILTDILDQLMNITDRLPFIKQTPEARRADGHHLFARAGQFTADVCFALSARPGYYADLPHDVGSIDGSQQLADLYYELHIQLQTLARLCEQSHFYYQAQAVRRAKANLEYILHGLRGACLEDGRSGAAHFHRRRASLLYPAFLTLREIRGHLPRPRRPAKSAPKEGEAAQGEARPRRKKAPRGPRIKPRESIGARLFAAFKETLNRGR